MTEPTSPNEREPVGAEQRAWSLPEYRRYLTLRFISLIGDGAWWFALAWEAARLGGPKGLGLVLALSGVPRLALSLTGGVLADRWGIRRTMIWADVAAAGLAAVTAGLWAAGLQSIWLLAAVGVSFSVVESIYGPSSSAFVRLLLSGQQLSQSAALRQSAAAVGGMVGTALGGILIWNGGMGVVAAIDAVTFLVIALGLSRIDPLLPGKPRRSERIWRGMRSAVRFVWRDVVVRLSIIRGLLLNSLGLSLINVGLVLRAQEQGWGSLGLGVVEASLSLGALISGLVVGGRTAPKRAGLASSTGFVVFACLLALVAAAHSFPLAAVAAFALGLSLVPASAYGDGLVQDRIPDGRLAAVNGVMVTVSLGAVPLGNAVFGFSVELAGLDTTALVVVVCLIVAAGVFLLSPALRNAQFTAA